MQENSQIILSDKQIRSNFLVISKLLYQVTKSDSPTDQEFHAKYDVHERLQKYYNSYGRRGQGITLLGVITYCLKGKSPLKKLTAGFLYTYWINHLFTLGSYVGIYFHLPKAVNDLCNATKGLETGYLMQEFLLEIKKREICIVAGQPYINDDNLLEIYNKKIIGEKIVENFKQKSYIQNDFYEKNYELFMKKSEKDDNPNHVFMNKEYLDDQCRDDLRLPVLDSFLSRYVYYSLTRWFVKVGQFLKVVKE